MTFVKHILIACLWVVVGASAALAGGFYFVSSGAGQRIARDYFVSRCPGASVDVNAAVSGAQVAAGLGPSPLGTSTVILVPKTNGTEDYYVAINTTVRAVEDLNDNNVALAPTLNQLNQKTLSCSFVGFYDLMSEAQDLLSKNKDLTTKFAIAVTDLATANTQTPDATTKVLTNDAVAKGRTLHTELEAYNTLLERTLGGDVPTSAQEKELYDQVLRTHEASAAFSVSVQAILTHFVETIKASAQ